ncbi:hypothetical protein [Paenibacillus auburnensis]|nr:hypothetical protein [Paenibacillus auburnensis]
MYVISYAREDVGLLQHGIFTGMQYSSLSRRIPQQISGFPSAATTRPLFH